MGWKLRRDLREALGPDITGLQRAVALEIADDASERTRMSAALLDDLVRWTGAKDADVVRNALKRLAAAGWEFRVPIGKGKDGRVLFAVPGTRVTFLVPEFEGVAVARSERATATPSAHKGEQGLPLGEAGATPTESDSSPEEPAGQVDVWAQQAPLQGGALATSTNSQGGAPAPPSLTTTTSTKEVTTSPGQGGATATPSAAGENRDYQMPKFGAFWNAYPRKKSIEKAKAAWRLALDDGADPDLIVAAAVAYAYERVSEDARFTPYPATWLDTGRYHDEPDPTPPPPAAGSGGHQPWMNPQDQDEYDEKW